VSGDAAGPRAPMVAARSWPVHGALVVVQVAFASLSVAM
jgi:hypothetical protein